ncbi:MAG: Clp protease N-terminal domain-containing protein [Acidimicrobiales bacterium]
MLAQEEARFLDHDHIGTAHLLLGVIHEESYAATALGSVLPTLQDGRDMVRESIGQTGGSPSGHLPFTPEAKRTLELSLLEASRLGHSNVGPEHILLGLLDEEGGAALRILVQLGADPSSVQSDVIEALSGHED